MQIQQGDLGGALKSYRDGLAIAERSVRSNPNNAGCQRDLSLSYEKIGDVQMAGASSLPRSTPVTTASQSSIGWRNPIQFTPTGSAASLYATRGLEIL